MAKRLLGVRIIRKSDGEVTFRALLDDDRKRVKVNGRVPAGGKLKTELDKLLKATP